MSRAASSLLKKLRGVSPLAKVREAAKGYPGAQEGVRRLSAVSFDKNKKSNQAEDNTLSYVSYENASLKDNSTPLIIQHALFGRKENFTNLGKKIHHVTKRSIIIPDSRNHGNSPKCANPSVKQMAVDLMGLQQQLKIEKSSILGFATGGRVAMMSALLHPDKVDRLVISNSSPLNTQEILFRFESFQQAAYIVHTLLKNHGISSKSQIVDTDFKLKLELDEALKDTLKDNSTRALFLSNLGKFKLKALMNNPDLGKFPYVEDKCFKGPVMFITGENQPEWKSDTDIRSIKQIFPNSHFVKIAGAGHHVHQEKYEDFLSAVVSFLETEL